MPPKASVEVTEASFKFIFSVLKHCDEIRPSWQAVADENGISYARNAAARFKDTLKKLGYRFENGKIIDSNDAEHTGAPAVPTTPKQAIKPKKTGSTSNKKRKLADRKVEEESEADGVNVKHEDGTDGITDEETA